jgi:hypothetical protein
MLEGEEEKDEVERAEMS